MIAQSFELYLVCFGACMVTVRDVWCVLQVWGTTGLVLRILMSWDVTLCRE